MSNHDKQQVEFVEEKFDVLKGAVAGLADRIELAMAEGVIDRQSILDDALYHLDILTGRGWPRGLRMEDR
jgi:hypothetical protein